MTNFQRRMPKTKGKKEKEKEEKLNKMLGSWYKLESIVIQILRFQLLLHVVGYAVVSTRLLVSMVGLFGSYSKMGLQICHNWLYWWQWKYQFSSIWQQLWTNNCMEIHQLDLNNNKKIIQNLYIFCKFLHIDCFPCSQQWFLYCFCYIFSPWPCF